MPKKTLKKSVKKTLKSRLYSSKLTEIQAEVLSYILKDFLTPPQMAKRRETSVQNIYQIIAKIRKKGYLSLENLNALKKVTHIKEKQVKKEWSYHGLHFLIRPYYFYPRYHKYRLEKGNYGVSVGDWIFKFHKGSVEAQSKRLVEFRDVNKLLAVRKGEVSFNRALSVACNKFGFEVYKEGKANIGLKQHHLEFMNSDVAKGSKEHYLRIRSEQRKTWFMIDMSKGSLNHEYTDEVMPDSERLEPFFNEIREGAWDDMKHILRHVTVGYSKQINALTEQIKLHLDTERATGVAVKEIAKTMKGLRKEIKKLGGKDDGKGD